MSIQILPHEFLGPPMEKVVYVVLARDKYRFHLVYAAVCEHTDDRSFFVSNDSFKCWMERAGSEESLYLAILPMFTSDPPGRRFVLDRTINSTKPPCNGVSQGGSRTPL